MLTSVETPATPVAPRRLSGLVGLTRRALKSPVAKNALCLYSIQIAKYVLPLVSVPYLVRVLGPEKLGLVAFGQGLMSYLGILVGWGFGWSATRKIAVLRDDPPSLKAAASAVLGARLLLCLISFAVLCLLIGLVPKFRDFARLLLVLSGGLVGAALFPDWLFQGLEKMGSIALINQSLGVAGTIAIFVFIHRPSDYLLYAALFSAQSLISGLAGLVLAWRIIAFSCPTPGDMFAAIKEGLTLFLSVATTTLYASCNSFLLGLVVHDFTIVGYYAAAEKLVSAALRLQAPISQAVFPRLSALAHQSKIAALRLGRQAFYTLGGLGLGAFAVFGAAAPYVVRLVLGSQYLRAVGVLRILSINLLNLSAATIWSPLIMISFKRDHAVTWILFGAGILNLAAIVTIVPAYGEIGMAWGVVAAETFVNVASFAYTWAKDLNPFKPQPWPEQTARREAF
jgi:PST family polysaccharide transporter